MPSCRAAPSPAGAGRAGHGACGAQPAGAADPGPPLRPGGCPVLYCWAPVPCTAALRETCVKRGLSVCAGAGNRPVGVSPPALPRPPSLSPGLLGPPLLQVDGRVVGHVRASLAGAMVAHLRAIKAASLAAEEQLTPGGQMQASSKPAEPLPAASCRTAAAMAARLPASSPPALTPPTRAGGHPCPDPVRPCRRHAGAAAR